ncbi:MAG: permease [Candidatus Aenigmatarchaeota archaeon]
MISGIIIGVVSGIVLGKMGLEKYLVRDIVASRTKVNQRAKYDKIIDRVSFGLNESVSIVRKLWFWVVIGVGIGAIIHNYVPDELIQGAINSTGILSVPLATLIGVPMYGSCAAIVPIAVALFQKGIPLGTALAFMMAVAALSLPEAIILRRAMKLKLIAIFFAIVTFAIILTGYVFNILQWMLV